jgi:hypothetical protein
MSDMVRPKSPIIKPTEHMKTLYKCGSVIEWTKYDKHNRSWDISIRLKCPPNSDWLTDDDYDKK